MPEEAYIVGDRVFLTTMQQFGTVLKVTIYNPHHAPGTTGERRYDIKLEGTGEIKYGVYRGIQRAPRLTQ